MSVWETGWRDNMRETPDRLLKIIVVREWEPEPDRPLGALFTALLDTFCRGLALPDINPVVGAWVPILSLDRFQFTMLYQVCDTLCEMREYATHQPAHYGMRWAQAGGIGAPQFYLHDGEVWTCPICLPTETIECSYCAGACVVDGCEICPSCRGDGFITVDRITRRPIDETDPFTHEREMPKPERTRWPPVKGGFNAPY